MLQAHNPKDLNGHSQDIESLKAEFHSYLGLAKAHTAQAVRSNIGMGFYALLTSTATYITFSELTREASLEKTILGTIASGLGLMLAIKDVIVADYNNEQAEKADKEARRLKAEIIAIVNAEANVKAKKGSGADGLDELIID